MLLSLQSILSLVERDSGNLLLWVVNDQFIVYLRFERRRNGQIVKLQKILLVSGCIVFMSTSKLKRQKNGDCSVCYVCWNHEKKDFKMELLGGERNFQAFMWYNAGNAVLQYELLWQMLLKLSFLLAVNCVASNFWDMVGSWYNSGWFGKILNQIYWW